MSHNPFNIKQVVQVIDVGNQLKQQNFVQKHHSEFIYDDSESLLIIDQTIITARFNKYFAAFFNTDETEPDRVSYLKSIPSQGYWNFLRDEPTVNRVEIYANLSLLNVTTDRESRDWHSLIYRERIDVIRVVEVWHQQLSGRNNKDLLNKLECSTKLRRQQLGGVFASWKSEGFAKKTSDRWEFDVPKMLEHYELTPLAPAAIAEFRQRGREIKERYES